MKQIKCNYALTGWIGAIFKIKLLLELACKFPGCPHRVPPTSDLYN